MVLTDAEFAKRRRGGAAGSMWHSRACYLVIAFSIVLFIGAKFAHLLSPSTCDAESRPRLLVSRKPVDGLHNYAWGSLLQAYQKDTRSDQLRAIVRFADELSATQKTARVLIVTSELSHTPVAYGGIGTFSTQLAQDLVAAGFSVVVLFTKWDAMTSAEAIAVRTAFSEWGVTVVGLPKVTATSGNSYHMLFSYRVLKHLLEHEGEYDVIHFHDFGALGYLPLLAKHQGWAIQNSATVVGLHGSFLWAENVNGRFPHGAYELSLSFCERRAIEMADTVWAPSKYMADFVHARRWMVKRPIIIAPLHRLISDSLFSPTRQAMTFPDTHTPELVFFGRLEPRKGVLVFVEAVAAAQRTVGAFSVTFLGRSLTSALHGDMQEWITKRLQRTALRVTFLTNLSSIQAIEYLREPSRVACMPSLVDNSPLVVYEALSLGLPFLSSTTGGIPELVHPDDVPAVLLPPTPEAWTAKIVSIMSRKESVRRPAPRFALASAAQAHVALHETAFAERGPAVEAHLPSQLPFVSVIITTHDRPATLRHVLDALAAQTYPRHAMEIIVVDDGSEAPETLAALRDIASDFISTGAGRVLMIENQYLGAARNRGASIARGDIFAFLDDDDVPVPEYLERLVTVAEYTGAEVLSTFFATFSGASMPTEATTHALYMFLGPALSTALLENAFGGANIFVRKQAFVRLGGFSELINVGYEDYEFLLKACLQRIHHEVVPAPLLWVRRTPGSMSASLAADLAPSLMRVVSVMQSAFSDDNAAYDISDTIAHVVGTRIEDEQRKAVSQPLQLQLANLFSSRQEDYNMYYGAFVVPRSSTVPVNYSSRFPPTLHHWALNHAAEAKNAGVICQSDLECQLDYQHDFRAIYSSRVSWDTAHEWPAWRSPTLTSTPFPWIDAQSMHPGATADWSILMMRTWRAFMSGGVTLGIQCYWGAACGDGTCLSLLHNGQAIWRDCNTSPSGKAVERHATAELYLTVSRSSLISLVVDPISNADCDATYFSVTITPKPV